jgi:predicted MFS family arabinose efflux permease
MPKNERKILLILAAIQFLIFLDFELLMPLGAYIGPDLGVNVSQLGELVSAYTLAAMVGAFVYSRLADRLDKRNTLDWMMAGLALGTLLCGLGHSYNQLLAARILAGLMAGPASAAVFAIVSDVVPEERRGQGIGIVMGGYTVASVLGLPLSVYFANFAGWRPPFIGLAAIAAVVIALARMNLPEVPGHEPAPAGDASLVPVWRQPAALIAWTIMALLMIGDFAFVPYLPTFFTANLGVAKSSLGLVYGAGGLTTLITFQFSGRLTDRFGSFKIYAVFSVLSCAIVFGLFMLAPSPSPLPLAVALMAAMFFFNAPRVLAGMTLLTKAVGPAQRGEFLSLQNVIQNGAVGVGSLLAAEMITGQAGGKIEGAWHIVAQNWAAVITAFFLIWFLERRLARDKAL